MEPLLTINTSVLPECQIKKFGLKINIPINEDMNLYNVFNLRKQ